MAVAAEEEVPMSVKCEQASGKARLLPPAAFDPRPRSGVPLEIQPRSCMQRCRLVRGEWCHVSLASGHPRLLCRHGHGLPLRLPSHFLITY